MRLPVELDSSRPRSLCARIIGAIALLQIALSGIALADTNDAKPRTDRPPFPMYLGLEAKRVTGSTRLSGPSGRIVLAPALQGTEVAHDILITNEGTKPLELRNVKACKGCILDGYSKQIRPGGTGRISILIVTDPYGGQTVRGTVRAETDDPERPLIEVDVSLEVKEFAALTPYRVWLKGRVGERIVETCTVVPNEDYPFEITEIKTRKGVWFDLAYTTIERAGRPAYEITLSNKRTQPGSYQDVLFVRTNHPERPEFKIRVEGRIEK